MRLTGKTLFRFLLFLCQYVMESGLFYTNNFISLCKLFRWKCKSLAIIRQRAKLVLITLLHVKYLMIVINWRQHSSEENAFLECHIPGINWGLSTESPLKFLLFEFLNYILNFPIHYKYSFNLYVGVYGSIDKTISLWALLFVLELCYLFTNPFICL